MEVRTIHYPLWHTSVQISAFIPRQGVAEYMAMVIPEPGVGDFAVQLEHIRSTIEYLLTEEWQGDVLPLLTSVFNTLCKKLAEASPGFTNKLPALSFTAFFPTKAV